MAHDRDLVPAAPFARIVKTRVEELERAGVIAPTQSAAEETGMGPHLISRLCNDRQQYLSFENADKIVTKIPGPMLWHTDPELNEIYTSVDISASVKRKPTKITNPVHGRRATYTNHGCRCDLCTAANRAYRRANPWKGRQVAA